MICVVVFFHDAKHPPEPVDHEKIRSSPAAKFQQPLAVPPQLAVLFRFERHDMTLGSETIPADLCSTRRADRWSEILRTRDIREEQSPANRFSTRSPFL